MLENHQECLDLCWMCPSFTHYGTPVLEGFGSLIVCYGVKCTGTVFGVKREWMNVGTKTGSALWYVQVPLLSGKSEYLSTCFRIIVVRDINRMG